MPTPEGQLLLGWDEEAVRNVHLPLYNDRSRKIDKIVFAQPDLSFGHYIVRPHDMQPVSTVAEGKLVMTPSEELKKDPALPDAIVKTDEADVDGHFVGEDTPKIVPLWKLMAGAFKAATLRYKDLSGDKYYVEAARGIAAKRMVLSGDIVQIFLKPRFVGEAGYLMVDLGVDLKVDNSIVGIVDTVSIRQGFDPNDDLKPMILEAAALTNGLDSLHQIPRPGFVPLFRRVGSINYADPEQLLLILDEGTELVTQSRLSSNIPEGFVAQAKTRVGLRQFADAKGIDCGFIEKERAIALYQRYVLRRRLQQQRAGKMGE